ncbi:MAG: M24 family metallopeptidase [Bdellovibrionales bacterium]|nr:M24 family metallopeptidase [Bdellovibrionales bacterium]
MNLKYDFAPSAASTVAWGPVDILERLDAVVSSADALVLTSKDPFLSEYVPRENNPRFGATRFSGSVGDAIYFTKQFRKTRPGLKPLMLFVDGRYHLQADQETDSGLVEVVKLDVEPNIESGVRKALVSHSVRKVALDFERTSLAALNRFRETLNDLCGELVPVEGATILRALGLSGWSTDRPVFSLQEGWTGRTLARNLRALTLAMNERTGDTDSLHLTVATDDAAFLLNARGYHLPHLSSILAYTFLCKNEFIVYLPECSRNAPVEIDPSQLGEFRVTVIRDSIPELRKELGKYKVKTIFFHAATVNGLLPTLAAEVFPEARVISDFSWVLKTRARKTPEEMVSIRSSFLKSSRAIARTLRFGKKESQGRDVSELELAQFLKNAYAEEGAVALSFGTISGAGANSAIVHYNTPSDQHFFEKGKLALLDSGAYYQSGFCTDCTRGFFVGGSDSGVKPESWQIEIYTATLKSAIQPFLASVDASLSGKDVDAWIRAKVKEAGYDYLHGTGHGIGIHVHEEGIRLSTLSTYPQSEYACVSVEPGIYLKGKGGVRVENVALLIPEGTTRYRYENVVFVGYDWDLIDVSRLTEVEKEYLKDYELRCRELGTSLTQCPL